MPYRQRRSYVWKRRITLWALIIGSIVLVIVIGSELGRRAEEQAKSPPTENLPDDGAEQ